MGSRDHVSVSWAVRAGATQRHFPEEEKQHHPPLGERARWCRGPGVRRVREQAGRGMGVLCGGPEEHGVGSEYEFKKRMRKGQQRIPPPGPDLVVGGKVRGEEGREKLTQITGTRSPRLHTTHCPTT